MIEIGRYEARAVDWKLGISSQGTEQIAALFQLDDGRTVAWYGYFSELTAEKTIEQMEIMGWDGVDISNPQGLDANKVQIVVEHEEGQDGKTRARVRWVNRIGGVAVKEELKGGALIAFKQRMQGLLLSRRQGQPRPAQPRQPAQRNDYQDSDYGFTPEDDDIPF